MKYTFDIHYVCPPPPTPPDYEKLIQNDASHLQDITGITIDLMVIKY